MDTKQYSNQQHRGDEGKAQLGGEAQTILIRSFSDPAREYEVTDTGCSCPHSRIQGAMCRHRLVFGVLRRIRRSAFGISRDEETAREIVARALDRTNRLDASYEALTDARYFRFSTRELVARAHSRHRENIREELRKIESGKVA